MASYHVMFDGVWQERFDDRAEALQWAGAAAEPGRIVQVVRVGWRSKLIAVFPESRTKEVKRLWKAQRAAAADEAAKSHPIARLRDRGGGGAF
jgi:hypothetical protein